MGSDPEPVYVGGDGDLVFKTSIPHLRLVRNDTAPDAKL